MRRLKIAHTTTYDYTEQVTLQEHRLLLRPREGHDIRIESSRLNITPTYQMKWQRDVYGNSVGVITFSKSAKYLSIYSEVVLKNYEDWPLDFLVEDYAVNFPFQYDPSERVDLGPYLLSIYEDDQTAVGAWLGRFWQPGQMLETYTLLDNMNKAIARNFSYQMREEPGVRSPAETLARGGGSCRDYATLLIEACRYLGLAARFVSGYLYLPEPPPGPGATHAWAEVYLPGAGWKGFDATGGTVVGNDHIATAVHRHPEAVPPVAGAFTAKNPVTSTMQVDVQVTEIKS